MPRNQLIQLRAGTAAAWTSANPVLGAAEPGLETDTLNMKLGDGATAWSSLSYQTPQAGSGLAKAGSTFSLALTKALVTATGLGASDVGAAPSVSPTFTGTVTVPTATVGDSTTKAASTAFVAAAVSAAASSESVNGGTP
jgi:hypothetical protein